MEADWTHVLMRDEDLYTGYPYAAITRRANKTARIALEMINTETTIDEYNHPYIDLINNSKTFTPYQFWRDISTFLDLKGVYYLMVIRAFNDEMGVGAVKEFKLLNPYNIRRVMSSDSLEVAGYIENRKGNQREIPKEMIIPMWELNPFNEDKPFSMIDALRENQFTLKTAGDYTRHSLKHNINAPGIVSTDVLLTPENFENFKSRIKGHTQGEPLFGNGSGAIQWQSMNVELSKAALTEIQNINRESLFAVSGNSKTTMGIEESGTTRDTARLQRDLNTEDHILPRIQLIIDALNLDYKNMYPVEFAKSKANIIVRSPLSTDYIGDALMADAKTKEFELYKTLISSKVPAEIASDYVMGEIDIDSVGDIEIPAPVTPLYPDGTPKEIPQDSKEEIDEPVLNQLDEQTQGQVNRQEGSLKNAIVNIEEQLVVAAMNKVPKVMNKFDSKSDIVTKEERQEAVDEMTLVLTAFYGIMLNLRGKEVMRKRVGEYALKGNFKLDRTAKEYIAGIAEKVTDSHINTVLDEILTTARDASLQGLTVPEIQSAIKTTYNETIVTTRAKTVARTETNRAFTRAQYEADRQFIEQNDLTGRAYKKWVTRSGHPCSECLALEAAGEIPFDLPFVDLNGENSAEQFETVEAGNLHPNCACEYLLIIHPVENGLKVLEEKYAEMDKRTKEAKQLLEDIQAERLTLETEKQEVSKKEVEIEKQFSELDKILDDQLK
jgi:hypothetical protein